MKSSYLYKIGYKTPPKQAGGKAYHLHKLWQNELRVPWTLVITWDAYERYQRGDVKILQELRKELTEWLDPLKSYAVRSSANIEDTREYSFAGQFKTTLDVQGIEEIAEAIRATWISARSPGVETYLEKLSREKRDIQMGVIIQEMVKPVVSGVAFSRNPMTGESEVIVEAVRGVGTALVQDGTTPLHWIWQGDHWKKRPSREDEFVTEALIEQVVRETERISKLFLMDVDLEWVYDGELLYWVQLREITSLKVLTVYSNRFSREMLPGMIKPLIWSVNIPLVVKVWVDLLTELVGKNDLKLDEMARSFYYRAYFNLSVFGRIWALLGMPQESLEMMMGVLPRAEGQRMFKMSGRMLSLIPRLLWFIRNKWEFGKRFEREYPFLVTIFEGYDWQEVFEFGIQNLFDQIDRLYADVQRLVYYNINIPILAAIYNGLLGRAFKKEGLDLRLFDVMEGVTEHLTYDPNIYIQELKSEFSRLDLKVQDQIRTSSFNEFRSIEGIETFQEMVMSFLTRFGHLSDSGNDFSSVPWREKPETILKLISQEAETAEAIGEKRSLKELKVKGLGGFWLRILLRRTQLFRLYREQISSLYTFGYGLFRPYFLALGAHFFRQGLLEMPEDVFYLHQDEVRKLGIFCEKGGQVNDVNLMDVPKLVSERKSEMERCRDVILPTLIYGEVPPVEELGSLKKLSGVPTSRGYYRGPARVVKGLDDFVKVGSGDVVVIPFSDVSWTPLFAKAGAIVSESGGMLSHSSIVAREYQIPAVVSVQGAMQLPEGAQISVDGFRGEVIVY